MEPSQFNQGVNLAQRGWVHKLLFGGILLGAIVVVGLGIFVYSMNMPAEVSDPTGADRAEGSSKEQSSDKDASSEGSANSEDTSSDGGWLGWLFGKNKTSASVVGTTTGNKGERQTFNALAGLKPTDGATFDLTTFHLLLATDPVPGSRISSNKRIVTVPNEGSYEAQSSGSISYAPGTDFTGKAVGVGYEITDTSGATFVGSYAPTVKEPARTDTSPQPVVCSDPASQGYQLLSKRMYMEYETSIKYVGLDSNLQIGGFGAHDVYVASYDNYLYRSSDNGQTWKYISPDTSSRVAAPIVAADGNHVYLKIYDETNDNDDGSYVYSDDKGDTWSPINTPADEAYIRSLSSDGQKLVLGYYDFLDSTTYSYYSANAGVTWVQLETPADLENVSISISGNGETLYVGGASADTNVPAFYRSTDGGSTWSDVSLTPTEGYSLDPSSLRSSFDGSTLIVTAYNSETQDYISYRSTDAGATWTQLNTDGNALFDFRQSDDGTVLFARSYDLETYEYYFHISRNGGETWQDVPLPDGEEYVFNMDLSYDGTTIIGSGGGSFITENDGSTWTYPQDTQQPFDQSRIDLDPATPGQQLILDRSVSDGWIIRYDPIEDILSSEVTNEELFPKPQTLILPYTLVPAIGCADPVPGKLIIRYTDLG